MTLKKQKEKDKENKIKEYVKEKEIQKKS